MLLIGLFGFKNYILTDDENDERLAAEEAARTAATVIATKPGELLDTEDLLYDERVPTRDGPTKAACERLFVLMNGPAT